MAKDIAGWWRIVIYKLGLAVATTLPLTIFPDICTAQPESFSSWKARNEASIKPFEEYLRKNGLKELPPFEQLFASATDWRNCENGAPYFVPPVLAPKPGRTESDRYRHWRAAAETLKLYEELRARGIIDEGSAIVSTYRPAYMAACVQSKTTSAHTSSFAIDIVGSKRTSTALCRFYKQEGRSRNLGLSMYPSGRIHLDLTKHRTWGKDCTCETSYCAPCIASGSKKC